VIHDGIPYDSIQGQGQGHGSPQFAKMADCKVYRPSICNAGN